MCGIIGILGREPVAGQIVDALKRLEYRGYDSAGVATLENGGTITRRRAEGKLKNLEELLDRAPLEGKAGIGHTRWATHGRPNEINAHPHATDRVAVVHNGIIENFRELREELEAKGHHFATETDTEVVAHLVTDELQQGHSPAEAVAASLPRLRGRLRARLPVQGRRRPADRRAQGLAARGRLWRRRDVSRLRRHRARALHRYASAISKTATGRCVHRDGRAGARRRPARTSSAPCSSPTPRRSWSTRATTAISWPRRSTSSRKWSAIRSRTISTWRTSGSLPDPLPFDFAKLDRISISACGTAYYAGLIGEVLVRTLRAAPGRDRCRLGIPLPRGAADGRRSRDLRVAIGRDRRHAGLAALRQSRRGSTCCRSSMCRPRPSRGKATW